MQRFLKKDTIIQIGAAILLIYLLHVWYQTL